MSYEFLHRNKSERGALTTRYEVSRYQEDPTPQKMGPVQPGPKYITYSISRADYTDCPVSINQ
jgi:hypothetical protein